MISPTILVGRGIDADGKGDEIDEEDGCEIQHHREIEPIANNLRDRKVVFERVAKVPLHQAEDPDEILLIHG